MAAAAARSSRRLASLSFRSGSPLPIPQGFDRPTAGLRSSFPPAGAARNGNLITRGIHTQNESLCTAAADLQPAKGPAANDEVRSATVNYSASSRLRTSARHDTAMIFTCKVCETRSVKTISRESYEKGVVLARCGGCNNVHLIADRLGWFGEPGSVEDFLAERGEEIVKAGSADTLNLTLDDLLGRSK